jgi:hypothetical protein
MAATKSVPTMTDAGIPFPSNKSFDRGRIEEHRCNLRRGVLA